MVSRGQHLKSANIMPYELKNSLDALNRASRTLKSPISQGLPVILICAFHSVCRLFSIFTATLRLGSKTFQIMGPIPGSTEPHRCYASRVFFNVFDAPNDGQEGPHCFENCTLKAIGPDEVDPLDAPAMFNTFHALTASASPALSNSLTPSGSFPSNFPMTTPSPSYYESLPQPMVSDTMAPQTVATPQATSSSSFPSAFVCLLPRRSE